MNQKIYQNLEHKIVESLSSTSLDLAYGKMGICIYFYYLGWLNSNKYYLRLADKILRDIFSNVQIISNIGLRSGLSGIAFGIHYLLKKKYVKGDVNKVLKDVDDEMFRQLVNQDYFQENDVDSVLELLFYFDIRVRDQKRMSESEWIYKEIIIKLINRLHELIDVKFFEEPFNYTVDYKLPRLLYVLGNIYNLNIYNDYLDKFFEEIWYRLYSFIPMKNSNRLYLIWSIHKFINNKPICELNEYYNMLLANLNIYEIIDVELKDKNIFFNNGLVSIYLFLSELENILPMNEVLICKRKILKKIASSEMWDILVNDPFYFNTYKGVYNGCCGTLLFMKIFSAYED